MAHRIVALQPRSFHFYLIFYVSFSWFSPHRTDRTPTVSHVVPIVCFHSEFRPAAGAVASGVGRKRLATIKSHACGCGVTLRCIRAIKTGGAPPCPNSVAPPVLVARYSDPFLRIFMAKYSARGAHGAPQPCFRAQLTRLSGQSPPDSRTRHTKLREKHLSACPDFATTTSSCVCDLVEFAGLTTRLAASVATAHPPWSVARALERVLCSLFSLFSLFSLSSLSLSLSLSLSFFSLLPCGVGGRWRRRRRRTRRRKR